MPVSEALSRSQGSLPNLGASALKPRIYSRHQFRTALIFGAVLALVVPPLALNPIDLGLLNLWLLYSVIAVGFYFIFAVAGQFALSQAFMAMLGGFVSAVVSEDTSFIVGVVAGMAAAGVVSALFALLMRRVNDFYFAIATLGLAQVGTLVIRNWDALGGQDGTRIGIAPATVLGRTLRMQDEVFWLILVVLVLVLLAAAAIERSPFRRELIAVQHNSKVATTLGVPVLLLRVTVFALGSMMAALAGAVYSHWQGFMSIEAFGLDLGIGIFIMVLFGGTSSVWGPVIGAAFYVWVPAKVEFLSGYQDVFFGALILLIIVGFPDGLLGIFRLLAGLPGRRRGRAESHVVPEESS